MLKKYLEAGKIVGTHGLKGDVKVEPWCDSADILCSFKFLYNKDGTEKMKVRFAKVHKQMAIIAFEGINTIEQADMLRGKLLYINREDFKLEEGCYFIQDIIGLDVIDCNTGENYGTIIEVLQTSANDVYQIRNKDNKEFLIPVIDDIVIKTDINNGKVLISPIEGLFDE